MNQIRPRLLIAGTGSGSGKTTMTSAILSALKLLGKSPIAFKCGPDFIDPMFHREVTGIPCRNLDLFLMKEATVRSTLHNHGQSFDLSLIEGVMGLYDGIDDEGTASANAVSLVTGTPVLLVVNVHGKGLSVCAEIFGFLKFMPNRVQGILLNHCPDGLVAYYRSMIQERLELPVVGALPAIPEAEIGSRHLGLITAAEISDLRQKLDRLGQAALQGVNWDLFFAIAAGADRLDPRETMAEAEPVLPEGRAQCGGGSVTSNAAGDDPVSAEGDRPLRIGISRDEAFCFYYQDNLDLLETMGAQLVFFSPLHDPALPDHLDGLILWGGYPELHARTLSENQGMLQAIRTGSQSGLPIYAECGGFMLLHEAIRTPSGEEYPMAGVFPGITRMTDSLQDFGYARLTANADNLLLPRGAVIPAHSFHHSVSDNPGDCFTAVKAGSGRSYPAFRQTRQTLAGYPHLLWSDYPEAVSRFLAACRVYQTEQASFRASAAATAAAHSHS